MITKRDYFQMLVNAARDGTFPSVTDGVCAYRGRNGKKCAIGLILTDEEVNTTDNNASISLLSIKFPSLDLNNRVEGLTIGDLAKIQNLHDTLHFKNLSAWPGDVFIDRLKQLPCFKEFA